MVTLPVIGFKLVDKEDEVIPKSLDLLKQENLRYVIGNTVEGVGKDVTTVWIIGPNGLIKKVHDLKKNIAKEILRLL